MEQRHRGDAVERGAIDCRGQHRGAAIRRPAASRSPGYAQQLFFVAVVAATAPLHYGLMHETMHGHLFGDEKADRAIGRMLGILLGLPWETMRFGHLAHHSQNRHSFDRPEALRPGQARFLAALVYYFKLSDRTCA